MALIDNAEFLRNALDYHLERHNLLASNLAHIDTPGYKPVDLERTGVGFSSEMHVAMTATSAGHMSGSDRGTAGSGGTGAVSHGRVVEDPGSAAGGDNNGVDLDREAVKIASNQMRYDMLAQLASSELDGLEWAVKDGK